VGSYKQAVSNMNINFTTIAQGEYGDHYDFDQRVIYNSAQWHDLWEQHTCLISLVDDLEYSCGHIMDYIPQVNFDHYSVIAVFAGEYPSSGYSINILNVNICDFNPREQRSSLLTVQYKRNFDTGKCLVHHTSSHPYHIIKIPKIDDCNAVFEQV
jgi:PrcB C-terminal